MTRILLSAAGGPVIVGIIDNLQASGHVVIGIDADPMAVGRHFCDSFYQSPLATNTREYLEFLGRIEPEFDLFFPFIDEELMTLADYKGPVWTKMLLSSPETLKICTDKIRFQAFAEKNGLPVAPSANTPPLMAKVAIGRGGKGVIAVADAEMLAWVKHKGGYVLQRKIAGIEYTVDILTDKKGQWVYGVARKRLRAAGVSVTGQIDMNKNVLDAARTFVEALPFAGPINIQVIEEETTGKAFVIEINPRLSGSLEFTRLAGFDIVQASIDMFEGRALKTPTVKDRLVIQRYWKEYVDADTS